ncbi:MAG: hypothetical protein FD167_2486, partial [bacterium]
DPDYTVNYHLDSLYQKSQTKTEIIAQQDKIIAHFANQPIQVPAEKTVIKQVLGL